MEPPTPDVITRNVEYALTAVRRRLEANGALTPETDRVLTEVERESRQ